MRFARKYSDGEYWLDAKGFQELKDTEFIVCFNQNEKVEKYYDFFCCVCNKQLQGLISCKNHWGNPKHCKEARARFSSLKRLKKICGIKSDDECWLTVFLENITTKHILMEDNIVYRKQLCHKVESVLKKSGLKDLFCRLYGSSVTGIGQKTADVNIDVQYDFEKLRKRHPNIYDDPSLLIYILGVIKTNEQFCDVIDMFDRDDASIWFTDVESGLRCCICPSRKSGFHSSLLIKKYMSLDERAKSLSFVFKKWAKTCGLDDQDSGGLPPYSYSLLVIHYLQQIEPPVLPVIRIQGVTHNKYSVLDGEREKKNTIQENQVDLWKSKNTESLGKLWVNLFRYYLITFHMKALVINIRQMTPIPRLHRRFGSKRIAIEDPHVSNRNIGSSMGSQTIMNYLTECLKISYKYFSCEKGKKEDVSAEVSNKKKSQTQSSESEDVGKEALLDILDDDDDDDDNSDDDDDYNDDDGNDDDDDDDDDDEEEEEEEKILQNKSGQAELDREKTANQSLPDDVIAKELAVSAEIKKSYNNGKNDTSRDSGQHNDSRSNQSEVENKEESEEENEKEREEENKEDKETVDARGDSEVFKDSVNTSFDMKCTSKKHQKKDKSYESHTDEEMKKENNQEEKIFSFSWKNFAPEGRVPVFCIECNNEGHKREKCPILYVKLEELKPLSIPFVKMLDGVCEEVMKDFQLTTVEINTRIAVLQNMEGHLQNTLHGSCRLSLFGSSVNGFGFQQSDLDICLRFQSNSPPHNLDYPEIIVNVSKALGKHPDLHKVMYIKSAKVPIVKFCIKPPIDIEGDISLYNCLALNNSLMLLTYANIDHRVRTLGYCIKVFAKICDIGDASRGSLSSYAYILLLLHYLQHCEPPVIPNLQELYDHSKPKPENIVDNWNTWFYSDLQNLGNVWPGLGKNKQSVGTLWLGFFRYYLEKFNFNKDVVMIRRQKKLTKFQKGWSRASMAIEDPFNHSHNLGVGLTKNMHCYIIFCFVQARLRYGSTPSKFDSFSKSSLEVLKSYFFDTAYLTGNKEVPKDRLCRRCGKIGHTVARCAEKVVTERDRRKRQDSEKEVHSKNGENWRANEDARISDNISEKTRIKANDNSRYNLLQESPSKQAAMANANRKCFLCHQHGHVKRDCPTTKEKEEKRMSKALGAERKERNAENEEKIKTDNETPPQLPIDFDATRLPNETHLMENNALSQHASNNVTVHDLNELHPDMSLPQMHPDTFFSSIKSEGTSTSPAQVPLFVELNPFFQHPLKPAVMLSEQEGRIEFGNFQSCSNIPFGFVAPVSSELFNVSGLITNVNQELVPSAPTCNQHDVGTNKLQNDANKIPQEQERQPPQQNRNKVLKTPEQQVIQNRHKMSAQKQQNDQSRTPNQKYRKEQQGTPTQHHLKEKQKTTDRSPKQSTTRKQRKQAAVSKHQARTAKQQQTLDPENQQQHQTNEANKQQDLGNFDFATFAKEVENAQPAVRSEVDLVNCPATALAIKQEAKRRSQHRGKASPRKPQSHMNNLIKDKQTSIHGSTSKSPSKHHRTEDGSCK